MGAGASLVQGEGPFSMEQLQEQFGAEFASEAFDTAKDEEGKVTKEALLAFIEKQSSTKPYIPESYASAAEVLKMIHSKEKSCIDVVSACFDRIAETKKLNCTVEVLKAAALKQAKSVDDKISNGETLRTLEGLPIVVKTNIHGPSGSLCTAGTAAFAEHRPTSVAPVLQSLLDQGAIAVAKVHMLELATGCNGTSGLDGRCLNPHNIAFNCGGSSSGTAVSIAAGIASCGLGTDTAGSCRIPAALNGVCGFRPSTGRLSTEGIVPCSLLLDTAGPMGSCVGDLCLLDSVISQTDLVTKSKLTGKKFVVPRDFIAAKAKAGLSEAVQKSLDVTKAALETAGAEVVEMDGFLAVTETNKEQWINPMVPFVFGNSHEDLSKYIEGLGDSKPVATVEDILAKVPKEKAGVIQMFTKSTIEAGELQKKIETRDQGRAALEGAYRAFFKDHGVSAIVMPAFPNEITKIDIQKEALFELTNEYTYSLHMNEISIPSMVMPVKSVKHPESSVPCSLLIFGTEDREMLGLALGLEAALDAANSAAATGDATD